MRGHVSDSQTGSQFSPSFPHSPCIHQSPAGMSLGLGFPTNKVLVPALCLQSMEKMWVAKVEALASQQFCYGEKGTQR